MDHFLPMQTTHPELTQDTEFSDDAMSDFSDTLQKPLDYFDEARLEDARPRRYQRRNWWSLMVMLVRRKNNKMMESKENLTEGLLAGVQSPRRMAYKKRNWYNYCIFGGIGGSTIL